MEFLSHQAGTFCWADLATNDVANAKAYYEELFSATSFNMPTDNYIMLNVAEKPVSAIYELMPEQKELGVPPHWMSYVACDDINAVVEKVQSNGGIVVMAPWEAGEYGIGALIQDPEGAMLGLWQAKTHIGAAWKNRHGAVCWFEHASKGSKETISFYEKVFGYTSKTEMMGETLYTTFFLGEIPVAGLYVMPEMMSDLPCHWLVYFNVNSIDKAIELTTAKKGEILMPKMAVPGIGFFSVVRDPQGAVFGLIESGM